MKPFEVQRLAEHGKVCELPMCIPAEPATYRVRFDNGGEVLVCDKHGDGIVNLAIYLAQQMKDLD